MATIKPTLKDPMSDQSVKFEKDFKKTMIKNQLNIHETYDLNETDGMLSEVEQSLKKKIFSLAKMEALVFSDPKLSTVYEDMAENGEEKYGYHYNETIQNMIFNDYVLNSPKYLQKYKMAIPKEKKRRDKSGINKLKKAGEEKMAQTGLPKQKTGSLEEEIDEIPTKVLFLINNSSGDPELFAYFPEEKHDEKYNMGYSHIGQHSAVHPEYAAESREASPEEYQNLKAELEGLVGYNLEILNGLQESTSAGSAGGATGYVGYAGPSAWSTKGDLLDNGKEKGGGNTGRAKPIKKPISKVVSISESEYLTDSSGFEKYIELLNEESDASFVLNNSQAYGSIDNMNSKDQKIIKKDIQNGKLNSNANIKDGIALQEKAKSKAQQRFMGMVNAYKNSELDSGDVSADIERAAQSMTDTEVDDFASTKHKGLPDHVDEGYTIVNPEPMKQIGWLSLPNYKSGGVSLFNVPENDDFGKRSGADYIMASPYEDEYKIVDDGNNQYHIEQNPRFWQRYINVEPETRRVVFMDDNEKFKYLGKYKDIQIDPNKRWSRDSDTEKFWNEIKELQRNGASFEFNGKPVFDNNNIKEDTQTMIQNNNNSMSNKAQATGDMSSEVPMGTQATSGLNEEEKLLEEINKELEAFSIHHDKLKLMSEDRKTTSQILNKRVNDENPKNFKKDLQHSGTKKILDVEKELEWKDQQTDVKDPQKLGADIEKQSIKVSDAKSGEALKNVGNSTNDDGDEIPKRNLTTDEQEEINLYRNGLHSLTYDNKPDQRFEDRMKADMGDDIYDQRQKQLEFKGKAPMYNKDPQPIEDTTAKKVQFDKEQIKWNERIGIGNEKSLKESMITGSYHNEIGDRHLIDFNLNEVSKIIDAEAINNLYELDFTGLGNTYNSKTINNKVIVNEGVVNIIESNKFFTNGKEIFSMKNPVQQLTEGVEKEKKVINEEFNKMKHLFSYKPDSYINTKNVKKNMEFKWEKKG